MGRVEIESDNLRFYFMFDDGIFIQAEDDDAYRYIEFSCRTNVSEEWRHEKLWASEELYDHFETPETVTPELAWRIRSEYFPETMR